MHRLGIVHADDDMDPWSHQAGAREAMARMFQNGGGIYAQYAHWIVQGNVYVAVTIYAVDGNFTSLTVDISG